MADLVDVQNALVALISQTLYPGGITQPSVTGVPTIIYAGWPTSSQLDADLLALSQNIPAGRMHVTVFPSKMERNTTRYLRNNWVKVTEPDVTITLTVSGQQVTVGGSVSTPQNVMLLVNGQPYIYGVQPDDTLQTAAAALAALVPGASSAGSIITLAPTANLTAARVGGSGSSGLEIRRQERVFQVTVWGDTPAHRDVTSKAIDPVLGNIAFLSFPDQSRGYLQYRSTNVIDLMSKAVVYRRDLNYSVDYPTIETITTPQIMTLGIHPSVGVAPPFQPTATVSI
jgi:hypothetical protein